MSYQSDSPYVYLLNGLSILNLQMPYFVGHPGVTLEVVVAAIVGFRHIFQDLFIARAPLTEDVLQHPEVYLRAVNNFLVYVIAALHFFIGIQIYRKTKSVWNAVGFQLFPFTAAALMESLAVVSSEPLLVLIIFLVTALLIEITMGKQPVSPYWQPILLGVLLGAGLITKVIFLPFLLLVLWLPLQRGRILAAAASVVTMLFLSIPIWLRLDYFSNWMEELTFNQGIYGSGSAGILPTFNVLISNLKKLAQAEPVYFIVLAVFILWGIGIWKNRTPENNLERFRVTLSIVILLFQLILVIKMPAPRYMITGIAWLGFCLFMAGVKLQSINPRFLQAVLLLLVGAMAINVLKVYRVTHSAAGEARQYEAAKVDDFIWVNYASCAVIPYYRASEMRYALLFGDDFTDDMFAKPLEKIYPNTISYNIWSKSFMGFINESAEQDVRKSLKQGRCILMRGGNHLEPGGIWHNPRLVLKKIFSTSFERVYQLQSIEP